MVSVLSISPLVHTPESSSSWWSGRLLAHLGVFSMPALTRIGWEGAENLMSRGAHYSVILLFTTACPKSNPRWTALSPHWSWHPKLDDSYPDYKILTVVKIHFCELWEGVMVYGCPLAELQEIARKMQKRRYKKEAKRKEASKQCPCTYTHI